MAPFFFVSTKTIVLFAFQLGPNMLYLMCIGMHPGISRPKAATLFENAPKELFKHVHSRNHPAPKRR